MRLKDAFVRATRAALWAFVGAIGAPTTADAFDIAKIHYGWLFALYVAAHAFVVGFAVNLAEDNTAVQLPK